MSDHSEHLISMAGGDGDTLGEIEARANAAERGPWTTAPTQQPQFAGVESNVFSARGSHILLGPTDGNAGQATNANAEFIANARTDVPYLLTLVREQSAKLEAVTKLTDRWATHADGRAYYAKRVRHALGLTK